MRSFPDSPSRAVRRTFAALLSAVCLSVLTGQSVSGAEKLVNLSAISDDSGQPAPRSSFEDLRPSGQPIVLQVSLGTLLHLSTAARTVFVADAEVVDVQVKPADSIFIFAKKPGVTALYAADEKGNMLLNKTIRVDGPVTIIRRDKIGTGGQPEPRPQVLEIPVQAAASTTASTGTAGTTR
jgi:Flp pilus assembly secretin CpaC